MVKKDYYALNAKNRKDTESRGKDALYNKIVDKYSANEKEFKWHDKLVWQGSIYTLPELFGYIVFFVIFLYLAHLSFNRYGEARTVVFFILLLIWRVNVGNKFLAKLNSKL